MSEKQATPDSDLKRNFMNCNTPLSEREHWARNEIEKLRTEVERLKTENWQTCGLVAQMHRAAMNDVIGPKRGVVEDILDLRLERDALKAQLDALAQCSPVAWMVKFKRNSPSEDRLVVWSRDRAEKEVAPHLITSVEPLYTKPHPATEPVKAQAGEPVAWGIDWSRDGDRSCCSIVKKHQDGTLEIVACEYEPLCKECGGNGVGGSHEDDCPTTERRGPYVDDVNKLTDDDFGSPVEAIEDALSKPYAAPAPMKEPK